MANNDTRRLRVVVTGESSDAQQSLEQVGDSADHAEGKLKTLAKAVAGFAGKGVLALGAVGAAAATMGFSTATQLEQISVGFKTMLGSAEKADKFLHQLQQFANTTPFEFQDVVGAAQDFLAMGFAAKDVIPTLTAVGDAVAAMGGSAEQIDSVTTALTQMKIKGKVSGEEIMQLAEQGIPAIQILADKFKVSTGEMSAMITKGQVMASTAIPMIIDGLEHGTKSVKGFGGMMAAQSQTISGRWSTLMDSLHSGLGNLAFKFLPVAGKAIDIFSATSIALFSGIEGRSDKALKGLAKSINEVGLGLRGMVTAFKDGEVTSDGLVGKFQQIGVALKFTYNAIIETAKATRELVGWFKEHDTITKSLIITIGTLTAVTKAYAVVTYVQAAGGLLAMAKNLAVVQSVTKVVTAVQWAYNGALAAASYLQIAGYLSGLAIAQKAVAVWTKVVTAAQWLWNAALTANPIGLIVAAIAVLVGAVVYLWNHNEKFRKFVLTVLWPALKKAWEGIKNVIMVVVNALVAAFIWLRDWVMKIWNAIWSFLAPIVQKIIQIISPIISFIMHLGQIMFTFYANAWKVVWILIQIAVKLFVMYFQNVVWPAIKGIFMLIAGMVKFLYNNVWKPTWDLISFVIGKAVSFITGTVIPGFIRGWNILKGALQVLKNFFSARWNEIVGVVRTAWNLFAGPIAAILSKAIDKIKNWINTFKVGWGVIWDTIKNKVSSIWTAISRSFNVGVSAVSAAWNKLKDTAKAPINFVINDIYNNRIRAMWNKVAEKFGIKTRLDPIKGFARGGIVGQGYGTKDDQLALLMRGEGILTTREMKALGGPAGFKAFRDSLAQYGKGGVVGGDGVGSWFSSLASKGKDIIQGVAGTVIKPLVNSLRNFINNNLGTQGFTGLMRGGANKILDNLVSWVSGKDKAAGLIGGGGGIGMGYQNQMKVLRQAFPGLAMISGFRPGAHTLSGNLSYHAMGRAVDVPAIRAVAMWIRQHYGASTKELITPWPSLDLRNGKFHDYSYAIDAQHGVYGSNAHVHWAMDSATVVQPGWFTGYNGTGKPETLVNADLLNQQPIVININNYGVGNMSESDVRKIRTEILKLANRNGGRSGLPGK